MERIIPQEGLIERLYPLAEKALSAVPLQVVFLEWGQSGHQKVLRVYIEREGGEPVNLDDCSQADEALSLLFEAEDPIPFSYTLEVSSLGVDRPLVRPSDLEACRGQMIRLESAKPIEGRKRFFGKLYSHNGQSLQVEMDGQTFSIPFAELKKARLDYFASQEMQKEHS